MPIEIHVQIKAGSVGSPITIKLTGSLDAATAPELERQLTTVLANPARDLVFDLAQLKFISSAGLRVFAHARKELQARGGQASFVNMQPQIREVFAIVKSLPGVAVFQSMEELDQYLAARQKSYENR